MANGNPHAPIPDPPDLVAIRTRMREIWTRIHTLVDARSDIACIDCGRRFTSRLTQTQIRCAACVLERLEKP